MKTHTIPNGSVSVVMCTYNGERYIREQLDSIVSRTYPIQEFIIQDDKSTDGTVSIIQEYAGRYPYIRLYQNKQNMGFNRNTIASCVERSYLLRLVVFNLRSPE